MANEGIASLLDDLRSGIKSGNTMLFLGAGASCAAGAPSGSELFQSLKDNFKITTKENDLIEICQKILDNPVNDRTTLEEFIKKQLNSLQPTEAHKTITKYNWAAIFTTNFDDLIEHTYRTGPDSLKNVKVITSDNFRLLPNNTETIYLFKIMGCMNAYIPEEPSNTDGQMVLSRLDYNKSLRRRSKYLKHLSDYLRNGHVIFIGYSFDDKLVFDVIDELIDTMGIDRLPQSYALFDKLQMNEELSYKFSSRKIRPIECSFEQFFDDFEQHSPQVIPKLPSCSHHIKVGSNTIAIADKDMKDIVEFIEVLTEEKISEEPGNKDDFFRGTNQSWGAFKENWDFTRDLYQDSSGKGLKDRVISSLQGDKETNDFFLITGMPGVGKTVILKRLAYDIYKESGFPVFFITPPISDFDYKVLATFIETLNMNIASVSETKNQKLKCAICVDDIASCIQVISNLKNFLTSRGRHFVIIGAERKNECDQQIMKIRQENIFEFDETLNQTEKHSIIEHLYHLGYVNHKGAFWDDIIKKNYDDSFFATIYSLIDPAKKPLNEIIQDQYQKLSPDAQKAFRYICCFHQYNLAINMELLFRALECTYSDFYDNILNKDAAKIIFEETDRMKNVLFRTHHRIIAEKTVSSFFNDPEEQKKILLEVMKDPLLTNEKEREIIENILIRHIEPEKSIYTNEQALDIFKYVCSKSPTRALAHHWGILESNNKNYDEAVDLLHWALELPRGTASFRSESDQNILTSLGSLCYHKAIDQTESQKSEEYFTDAVTYFNQAKTGEFPNVHAYHAHANLFYQRAQKEQDETTKFNYLAQAFAIIELAKDNLNEDSLQWIIELETQLSFMVDDTEKLLHNIGIIRTKFKSANGNYLYAKVCFDKVCSDPSGKTESLLTKALKIVKEGLEYFPTDTNCLRLRAKILKYEIQKMTEQKVDCQALIKQYYSVLRDWAIKTTGTKDNLLLYELGRTAFLLEFYQDSKIHFSELADITSFMAKRAQLKDPILATDGQHEEFLGTIIKKIDARRGQIKCNSLRNLEYPLQFNWNMYNFTPSPDMDVSFGIKFNFRGPLAVNVRMISR